MCSAQVAMAGGIEVPPEFYDCTGVYVGEMLAMEVAHERQHQGQAGFSGAIAEAKSVPIYRIETLFSGSKSPATRQSARLRIFSVRQHAVACEGTDTRWICIR